MVIACLFVFVVFQASAPSFFSPPSEAAAEPQLQEPLSADAQLGEEV